MELTTPKGHNMFEISSLVQKALRRGDAYFSAYSACEMASKYREYLWRRLLTVSAEDCYDMVTGQVLKLKELDDNVVDKSDVTYIEYAVGLLCDARKNRDADYFACNLFNSREIVDLTEYSDKYGVQDEILTKNGHDAYMLCALLKDKIKECDVKLVGYISCELVSRYRTLFWETILGSAEDISQEQVRNELLSLKKADDIQKGSKNVSGIYCSKALVIMLKEASGEFDLVAPNKCRKPEFNSIRSKYSSLPDYTYDCHTVIGKRKGRTKKDFIVTEQNALSPYKHGWFDELSWERYFFLEENGYWIPEKATPRPDAKIMKQIEKGEYSPCKLF